MSDEIFFDGVRFISAAEAAETSALSRDYIAKLCRDGKVSGRRIGKNWYLDERSLAQFLVDQEHSRVKRREELSQVRAREYHELNAFSETQENMVKTAAAPIQKRAEETGVHAHATHEILHAAVVSTPAAVSAAVEPAPHVGAMRERIAHAAYKHTSRAAEMAREFSTSAGLSDAALRAAHVPTYTVTPFGEFVHKLVALTLAFMLTFGTYALVDPQYARFALENAGDTVSSVVDSYKSATHGGIGNLVDDTQASIKVVVENPGATVASAATFFPAKIASLAKAINSSIDSAVYAVAFPDALIHRFGGGNANVALQIEPYARPKTPAIAKAETARGGSSAPATRVIQTTVIERVEPAETVAEAGGITEGDLDQKLNQLENKLTSKMYALSNANSTAIVQNYQVTAQTNRIDNLDRVSIQNSTFANGTITNSDIGAKSLTVSGGTTLAGLTVTGTSGLATTTVTGDLTVSGTSTTQNLSSTNATSTSLYTTSLQAVNASTTNATTTNFFATLARITTGTIDTLTSTFATITGLTVTNSTTTNATSTNSFATTASSTNLYSTNLNAGTVTLGNATSTNLYSTTASSTNLYSTNLNAGTVTLGAATSTSFFASVGHMTSGTIDTLVSTLATITGLNVTNSTTTNATTTNLYSTTASSTNLYSTNATLGTLLASILNVSGLATLTSGYIANSSSTVVGNHTVTGNGSFGGTFAVTGTSNFTGLTTHQNGFVSQASSTVAGNFTTTGTNAFTGASNFTGLGTFANGFVSQASSTIAGNVTLGASSANTVTFNGLVNSNIVPNGNKTYDLGSSSFYWRNAYIDTLNVNSIGAASTSIGGTTQESFVINSDNATADAQDMNLIFYRGTVVPNAVFSWNSAGNAKRFQLNQPLYISNQAASTTQTELTLAGTAGQTANIFTIASSSGATLFAIGPDGTATLGTASLGTTTITNLSVGNTSTSTFAGSLTVGGNLLSVQYGGGRIGIGTSSPASVFDIYGTDALRIPVGTTVQRPSQSGAGQVRYNTTTHQFEGYGDTGVWQGLGGVIDADQSTYITADTNNTDEDYLRFFANGLERMTITNSGKVGIGTNSPDNSAILDISTTTAGVLFPRLTTTQKNAISSPAAGLTLYDATLNKLNVYNGTTWKNVGSTEVGGEVTNGTAQSILFVDNGSLTPVLAQDNANFNYASSTHTLTVAKFSATAATTTNLFSTTASSTNLYSTNLNAGTVTLGNATSTNFFATIASSTNLFAQSAAVGSLTVSGATTQTGLATFSNGFLSQASSTVNGNFTTTGTNAFTGASTFTGLTTHANGFVSQASSTVVGNFTTSGNLTVGGTTNLTGLLSLSNASTSLLSVFTKAYFGGTATTTIDSAGNLAVAGTTNLSNALTYGGVTLSNSVTGTGNMVLSASPTLTGTLTAAAANFSGLTTHAAGFVSQASSTVVGNFTTTGSNFLGGTLNLTGLGTLASGFISQASSTVVGNFTTTGTNVFGGALNLTGLGTFGSGYVSQASSTVVGNHTVTGNGSFGGTLNVTGGTTLSNATSTNFFATTASSTNLFASSAQLGSLTVLGNTTHTGTLTQTGLATFTNGYVSQASSTVAGNFTTTGTNAFTGASTFTGLTTHASGFVSQASSTVVGNFTTTGNLTVGGTTSLTGLLSLTNASSSLLSVFNKAYFGGTATSTIDSAGNIVGAGTLNLSGLATLQSGYVSQASSTVNGNFTTTGTNAFTGASTFTGLGTFTNGYVSQASSTVVGPLTVTGATTLGSTLGLTGLATLSSGYIANSSSTVVGAHTVTGNQSVGGTLNVTGTTGLTGLLTLTNGYISNASSTVVGNHTVTGNGSFGGNLSVTGTTLLSSALTYGGVTLNNAVTGTGNMVLSASPTLTGTLTAAAANFSGATTHTGLATFANSSTTIASVYGPAYFGATATSSFDTAGNLSLASGDAYKINGASVLNATTLGSGVTGSSLTSVGTIATGVWQGSIINPTYGGTGVNNGANTITLGGNVNTANAFTTSGNFALTLTQTGATNVTLPTSGTLYGTAANSITSAQLASSLTDETGSGAAVFGTSPTISSPTISGGTFSGLQSFTNASTSLLSVFQKAYFGGTATTTIDSAGNLAVAGTTNLSGALTYGGVTLSNSVTGTGSMVLSASPTLSGTVTNSGMYYTSGTGVTDFLMNSAGTNWGTIQNDAGDKWSLGYKPNSTTALGTPVLTWNASGNVGIGTTSPYASLAVSSAAATPFVITNSSGPYRLFNVDSSANVTIGAASNAGSLNLFNGSAGNLVLSGNPNTGNVTINNANTVGGDIQFQTAGSNAVIFKAGGNVGIGTTSPATTFSIAGNTYGTGGFGSGLVNTNAGSFRAKPTLSSGASDLSLYDENASGYMQLIKRGSAATGDLSLPAGGSEIVTSNDLLLSTMAAKYLALGTNSTERLRIDSSGNVGIGTTSPQSKLAVSGGLSVGADYNIAAPTNGAIFEGNVGIGTNSAPTPLYVVGPTGTANGRTALTLTDNTNSTFRVSFDNTGIIQLSGNEGAHILSMGGKSGDNAAFTPRFTVNNVTGNSYFNQGLVGIGTVSPLHQLDVNLSPTATAKTSAFSTLNISNTATSTTNSINKTGLQISSTGSWTGVSANNIGLYVSSVTGGTNNYDAIFNGGGNVGIGTTSPATLLSVAGSGYLTGGLGVGVLNTTANTVNLASGGSYQINGANINTAGTLSNVAYLNQAQSFTALNQFTNASTSLLSAYGPAYFGGTATSSFSSTGALTLASALTVGNGGTGQTSFTSGNLLYGAGNGAVQNVATTSATIGSSLSYSGTFGALVGGAAGTLSLNMANANTWTGLQSFANASTSLLSVTSKAYFGGTATSTFDSAGNLALVSNGLTVGTSQLVVSGGSVGIGTTTPGSILSVQGAANFVANATSSIYTALSVGGNLVPSTDNAYYLGASTTRWTQANFGPSGVNIWNTTGTNYEEGSLAFSSNILKLTTAAPIGGNFRDIQLAPGNSTGLYLSAGGPVGLGYTSLDTSYGNSFLVSGRIGVATTTPASPITVSLNGRATGDLRYGLNLINTDYANSYAASVAFEGAGGTGAQTGNWFIGSDSQQNKGNNFFIATSTGTGSYQQFLFNGEGSFQLGQVSTAPSITTDRLYNLSGSIYWNGTNLTGGVTNYWSHSGTKTYNTTDTILIGTSTPTTASSLYITATTSQNGSNSIFTVASSTGTSLLTILGNGNVGIGTTTPNNKLTVGTIGPSVNTSFSIASQNYIAAATGNMVTWIGSGQSTYGEIQAYDYGSASPKALAINDLGGNVGIGTTSPQVPLTVANGYSASALDSNEVAQFAHTSSAYITVRDSGGRTGVFGTNQGPVSVGSVSNDNFSLLTNNAIKATLTTAGSFGIGTTTPAGKLTVETSSGGAQTLLTLRTPNNIGNNAAINFSVDAGTDLPVAQIKSVYTAANQIGLAFSTYNSGLGERMRIDNAGNVGIATTTPLTKLDIFGSAANLPASSGTTPTGDFRTGATNVALEMGTYNVLSSSGWIQVHDKTNQASNYNLLLQPNGGNVGIGTTSPTSPAGFAKVANIYDASSASLALDAGGNRAEFGMAAAGGWLATYGVLPMRFATNGAERMRVDSSGNLEVGTTTQIAQGLTNISFNGNNNEALAINENTNKASYTSVLFQTNLTTVGSITNTTAATAYNTSSDRRLKENIATSSLGLSTLVQIPVRNFDFKSDPNHAQLQGFIAQELQPLYPYAVTTNGDNGIDPLAASSTPWQVDYGRLTPLIVKSIQDLNSKFDTYIASGTATTTNLVTVNATTTNTDTLCLGGVCKSAWDSFAGGVSTSSVADMIAAAVAQSLASSTSYTDTAIAAASSSLQASFQGQIAAFVSTTTLTSSLANYAKLSDLTDLATTIQSNLNIATSSVYARTQTDLFTASSTLAHQFTQQLNTALANIATTSADLSGYAKLTDLSNAVNGLQSTVYSQLNAATSSLASNLLSTVNSQLSSALASYASSTIQGLSSDCSPLSANCLLLSRSLIPNADNAYTLGTAQNRFTDIYAHNINAGDLTFTETTSALSGTTLNQGDIVTLYVNSTAGSTHTIPVNLNTAINSNNWGANNVFVNTSGSFVLGAASTTAPTGKLDVESANQIGDTRLLTLRNTAGSSNAGLPYSFYVATSTGDLNLASNDNSQGALVNSSYSAWKVTYGGQSDAYSISRSPSGSQSYSTFLKLGSGGSLLLGTSTPSTPSTLYVTATTSQSGSNSILTVASSTGTSLLTVLGNGNVGIGTTTPGILLASSASKLLDVTGTNPALVLHNSSDLLKEVQIHNHTSGLYIDSTGAATASNNGIHFRTTNTNSSNTATEALTILSSGNVGIGTTTPTRKLQVQGDFSLGSSATNAGLLLQTNGSVGEIAGINNAASAYNPLQLTTGSSPTLYITAGAPGNVGIGTTTPDRKISIYSTTNVDGLSIDGTSNPAITIRNSNIDKAYIGVPTSGGGWINGSAAGDLTLRTTTGKMLFSTNNGASAAVVVDTAGNVGIGTTTVSRKLTVGGQDPGLDLTNVDNYTWSVVNGIASANDHKFAIYDRTANATRFTIDPSGQVAIGTNAPTSAVQLTVDKGANSASIMQLSGSAIATGQLITDSSLNFTLKNVSNGSMFLGTNNATRMTIDATGNVGIGITPSYKLDVSGTARFNNSISIQTTPTVGYALNIDTTASQHGIGTDANTSGYYGIYSTANVSGSHGGGFVANVSGAQSIYVGDGAGNNCQFNYGSTGWTCASDARIKTNIAPVASTTDPLLAISSLKPVSYTLRADTTNTQHWGFIAQDVAQVFPTLVTHTSATTTYTPDGTYGLDYQGLIAPTVAAVQQLNIKVDTNASTTALAIGNMKASLDGINGWYSALNGMPGDIAPLSATSTAAEIVDATSTSPDIIASSTPWVASFSDASQALKQDVMGLANYVIHFMGRAVFASNAIFEHLFAKDVHTDKLCISKSDGSEVCVTGDQLASVLAGTSAASSTPATSGSTTTSSPSSPSSSTTSNSPTSSSAPADTIAPKITVSGANPATVNKGDAYSDLGATVYDAGSPNIGIKASVDGGAQTDIGQIVVDTSVTGTHAITYSATDAAGNTGTAKRTVNVVDPNAATSTSATTQSAPSSTTTTSTSTAATSTTP